MEFNSLIQLKRERFDQLERDIADPSLFSNRQRAKAIMREHARLAVRNLRLALKNRTHLDLLPALALVRTSEV